MKFKTTSLKLTKKRAKKVKGCEITLETCCGYTQTDTFTTALKMGADYVVHNGIKIPVDGEDDENSLSIKALYLHQDRNCDLRKLMKAYHRMSPQQKVDLWHELAGR